MARRSSPSGVRVARRRGWPLVAIVLAAILLPLAAPAQALAATGGDVYVVDPFCCGGKGGVIRVDPTTGAQTVVASGGDIRYPFGIAVAADGLYITSQDSLTPPPGVPTVGSVLRVDPTTGAQRVISSGGRFVAPSRLVPAADGTLYVTDLQCCSLDQHGGVIRLDPSKPDGSNQTLISAGGLFVDPLGIAVADDGSLYIADYSCCGAGQRGGILRVDPAHPSATGANQTLVMSSGFVDPGIVAIADNGALFVGDWRGDDPGAILVFQQPGQGAVTTLAPGSFMPEPAAIALTTDGSLLVADQLCCGAGKGGVIRYDALPDLGFNSPTVVSDGQSFASGPSDIVIAPVVSIADATVTEGTDRATAATFSVTLSRRHRQRLTIPFTVAAGTATAGADFVTTSGTVTFESGQTTGTAMVEIVGDRVAERSETFTVTLQPPAGIRAVRATATGTIVDDGDPRTLSLADAAIAEGSSGTTTVSIPVTLSLAHDRPVTVQYATGGGTATAGASCTAGVDYQGASGTLTFASGETSRSVPVIVCGDSLDEPDETFTLTLSNPTDVMLGMTTATGTIRDDDAPPALTVSSAQQLEGNSGTTSMIFAVTLNVPSGQPASVHYATGGGAATAGATCAAGVDYQTASGTLTFSPGDVSKTVQVTICGDTSEEADEELTLALTNPSNASLATTSSTGLIRNDDTASAPLACTPRPRVRTVSTGGSGKLVVHVEATPLPASQENRLRSLRFEHVDNAVVTFDGRRVSDGQSLTLEPTALAVDFTVERLAPGRPTTVQLTVVDTCGPWQTFVGGGTAAGF